MNFPRTVDGAGLDARNVSSVRVGWRENDREDTWRFVGISLRADVAGHSEPHTFVDVHSGGSSRPDRDAGLAYFANSRDFLIYSPQLPVARFAATPRAEDLDSRTVDDLQQLAAEYGIPGRSRMTRAELISALRVPPVRVARTAVRHGGGSAATSPTRFEDRAVYEERTVDQLQKLATERGIRGRAQMNKAELITALCSIA